MKVLCPLHEDTTPSMEVYSDFSYCFACGGSVKTEDLDLDVKIVKRNPTNIPGMISYIQQLPSYPIGRGLPLPFDDDGYYIVWPDNSYYVRRNWKGETRYLAPRGAARPLFTYGKKHSIIVIVEGELNAMSLKLAIGGAEVDVVSPGSAPNLSKFMEYYLQYQHIFIVADRDAVGVTYGLDLKEKLTNAKKKAKFYAIEIDFNDLLQAGGINRVAEEFKKVLEVY